MQLKKIIYFSLFCIATIAQSSQEPEKIEEAFVSFATENYFPLLEVTVASIHAFSTRPIIVYGINADVPFDTDKYPRLIKRRINKDNNTNIYYQKFNCILQSNVKYGIYVEADDIASSCVDELFDYCRKVVDYPLCPIHPHDPNNQAKLMALLNVEKKTNPYVHGHIIFSEKCIPFIQECYRMALSLGNIGANWDETLLNVLLWKHGIHDYYVPIYDPYYEIYEKYIRGEKISLPLPVTFHMIHGCKNIRKANDILY